MLRHVWPPPPVGWIVRPVATVRASDQLGLLSSWVVHLLGVVLAGLGLVLLYPKFTDALLGQLSVANVPAAMRTFAGVGFEVMAEEGTFVVAAWVLMAYGSMPEPEIASFTRVLKRLWRLTPHLAATLILLIVLWSYLQARLPIDPSDMLWSQALPVAALFTLTLVWPMGVILAATWPPRWGARCRWPAHCEACDYPLIGLGREQSCPECGRSVQASLAEPSEAEHPGARGYLRLAVYAVRHPTQMGGKLKLLTASTYPLRYLSQTLGLLFVAATLGTTISFIALSGRSGYYLPPMSASEPMTYLLAYLLSLSVTAFALTTTLTLGSTLGSILTVHHRRPLLGAGLLAACYEASCWLPWIVGNWLLASLLVYGAGRGWFLQPPVTAGRALSAYFALNGAYLAMCLLITARAAAALRFANQ